MNKTSLAVAAIAVTGVSLALTAALGQTDDSKLGKVHFETSCKPEAQKLFDRGMLYQHSFWYRALQKTFEDVLKADPECAIAYWGIALSLLWNPHAAPAAQNPKPETAPTAPATTAPGTAAPAPAAPPARTYGPPMSPRQEAMLLRRACGMDYRTYCGEVPIGGGRVIECLRENGPSLSHRCRSALLSARQGR